MAWRGLDVISRSQSLFHREIQTRKLKRSPSRGDEMGPNLPASFRRKFITFGDFPTKAFFPVLFKMSTKGILDTWEEWK